MPTTVQKVEVEFTAGVWTDVTADFDNDQGWTIHNGRGQVQGQPVAGTASLRLRNQNGKYTPGVRILADGTSAPYWPNVTRRKRLRLSNTAGVRFLGYIKSWSPIRVNGVAEYCVIQAADRLDPLSRVLLGAAIGSEVLIDNPIAYWPMTEGAGSVSALDASGVNTVPLTVASVVTGGVTPYQFGQPGPGNDGETAVAFDGGLFLAAVGLPATSTAFTLECWVAQSVSSPSLQVFAAAGTFHLEVINGLAMFADSLGALGSLVNIADGLWHHLVGTVSGGVRTMYLDGTLAFTAATADSAALSNVTVGDEGISSLPPSILIGSVGQVALYNTALSQARVTAHYNAGMQGAELVSDKVKRFLTSAGLTSSDWAVDTSTVSAGAYPQAGKDVMTACQDMAVTEGGASALYVNAGVVTFTNRSHRYTNVTPSLTIDAEYDLDNTSYQPTIDDSTLVNTVQVSRTNGSTTVSTQTAENAASITADGVTSNSVTSYATTDIDALNLAQDIIATGLGQSNALRFAKVAVDLLTAKNNLYAAYQATVMSSRLRVSNLPVASFPATQADFYVEGWTENASIHQYQVVFDVSPADAPAKMVLDDTTYGRLQAQPDCALNASITLAATTVVIKSPTTPTFTTVGARYPLKIVVDGEIITLNSAPGGSSSPQTFTGCTRGVNGTTAAAHASNAAVALCPTSTLAL